MAAIVEGAGTSSANGFYILQSSYCYRKEDGHTMYGSNWRILSTHGLLIYQNDARGLDPPESGWQVVGGGHPAPSVKWFRAKVDAERAYQATPAGVREKLERMQKETAETLAKTEARAAELNVQLESEKEKAMAKGSQFEKELAAERERAEAAEAIVAELRVVLHSEKQTADAMAKAEAALRVELDRERALREVTQKHEARITALEAEARQKDVEEKEERWGPRSRSFSNCAFWYLGVPFIALCFAYLLSLVANLSEADWKWSLEYTHIRSRDVLQRFPGAEEEKVCGDTAR